MYTSRIKKILLILAIAIGLINQPVSASLASQTPVAPPAKGVETWLAAYDGPDKQADTGDAVAVDDTGNTYVAGTSDSLSSGKNIVLIKYSPTGGVLWVKIYNGPGSSGGGKDDQAVAIDIDDQGFVYLLGTSDAETCREVVVLRYRPDGTLDWEKRYHGPATILANQSASADAMQLADNAVYVSAGAYDDHGSVLVLLKYTQTGDLQWDRYYAAASPAYMAVAPDGSIYQAGNVYTPTEQDDIAVIKYDSSGNLSWDKIYKGSDHLLDRVAGLQADSQGNVLVVGTVERLANSGTATDAALIKYDPGGAKLWDRLIVDPNQHNYLEVFGFAADSAGSSYLFTTGMYIFRYESNGNQAWMIHSDELTDQSVLKIGPEQYLYITSAHGVMKFGPLGNLLLSYEHGTPFPINELQPTDFAFGPDGNIAITGRYQDPDTNSQDVLTIKYPGNPGIYLTMDDVFMSEGSRSSDDHAASFIVRLSKSLPYPVSFKFHTVDISAHAGSDYVATEGWGAIDEGHLWTPVYIPIVPDTNSEPDKQFQIMITSAYDVAIVDDRATATILDDDYDLVAWSKSISTPGSENYDTFDLQTDSQGNGYIKYGIGISSFGPSGILRWNKTFPGETHWMQLDAQDNLYQTGEDSSKKLVITKLDNSGNIVWERFYSDPMQGDHSGIRTALDVQGNVYVAGIVPYQTKPDPLYDTILLKYSQAGDLLWERRLHVPDTGNVAPVALFVDSAGNITLVGNAVDPVYYGIVAKYTTNGDQLWVETYRNTAYSWTGFYNAQYDAVGDLYLAFGGSTWSTNTRYFSIIIVNARGEKIWEQPCGFVPCGSFQDLRGFRIDPFGNLVESIADGLVVKFRNRNVLWSAQIPMNSAIGQAASDAEGFTYVTGGQQTENLGSIFAYMIFTPSGVPLYERTESGQGAPISGGAPFLALNKDRSVYAMGGSTGSVKVVKYVPITAPPVVSPSDSILKESENVQREMTFNLQLFRALDQDISLDFHTVDGTALAGQDYLPVQGRLTIPAHSRNASIRVPILSDPLLEPYESFYLVLSGLPDGVVFSRSIATGKIVDSSAIQVSLPLILNN
jgi:hypothetical protein